ncbi:MAG TPA: polyprenyl synthetase family protein [Candidatus Tidjanibacter gallistercoris]|nr:polyprenyl synthetase family protein [Candidatus Tidjanibacter gallistercoris]
MYGKEELSNLIETYIRELPFPEEPDTLYEPIVYSLEGGGKRLRPLLAMMACNMFSDDVMRALPCAAAVEVFHNFTLLHDDIMDNAAVRRGKPSVQRKWGSNSAILSGDAMMIYAYRLLEEADASILPEVLRIFNDTSLKVCEGQQYDMDFESLERVPMDDYLHMISLKTAVLLAGAAVIGATCGGASQEDCERIRSFAMELGMAFQIRDDVLDSYGTQDALGKKIGGDITEGKKTFLTTAAMEAADEDTRRKLGGLMHNREMLADEKIARVLAIYEALGVREQAEAAVERYTERAIAALEALSVPAARREHMERLAYELTNRLK